ncbi:hypothetical protein BIW11_04884 [Tropilaelaps mercedesae]|uniref:Uncharacterized protein n=1 Tax=Tropilaelaps mercedesae TaxID=418985 RepID=A0A1V9X071_9ACAR|nr:hypothetical protein BIW11_04884 [Tropilaelaps mercedesae]
MCTMISTINKTRFIVCVAPRTATSTVLPPDNSGRFQLREQLFYDKRDERHGDGGVGGFPLMARSLHASVKRGRDFSGTSPFRVPITANGPGVRRPTNLPTCAMKFHQALSTTVLFSWSCRERCERPVAVFPCRPTKPQSPPGKRTTAFRTSIGCIGPKEKPLVRPFDNVAAVYRFVIVSLRRAPPDYRVALTGCEVSCKSMTVQQEELVPGHFSRLISHGMASCFSADAAGEQGSHGLCEPATQLSNSPTSSPPRWLTGTTFYVTYSLVVCRDLAVERFDSPNMAAHVAYDQNGIHLTEILR